MPYSQLSSQSSFCIYMLDFLFQLEYFVLIITIALTNFYLIDFRTFLQFIKLILNSDYVMQNSCNFEHGVPMNLQMPSLSSVI